MRQSFGLTLRQRDLLMFIERCVALDGKAPTVREMMRFLALRSPSGVHALLVQLEERGHIDRMPGRARAIRLREIV